MASSFEIKRIVESNGKVLREVLCAINALDSDDDALLLQGVIDAINNLNAENENNLNCSIAKACDADCNIVLCHTCYDVTGAIVSTTHTNPDNTPFTGDVTTLDIGCTSCGDPIPTYEIISKDICFEDGTEGCQVFKVNTSTDEITLVNTLGQDGLPTNLVVVPCPKFEIVESTKCEL